LVKKEDTIPYTNTDPASLNILEPIPYIGPSLLPSIEDDVKALEKPVIGMKLPAPATLAKLSNIPNPVDNDARKIIVISVSVILVELSISKKQLYKLNIP
jgi:hypothetical protein